MPSEDLRVGGRTVRPRLSGLERDGGSVHLRPKLLLPVEWLAEREKSAAPVSHENPRCSSPRALLRAGDPPWFKEKK
jgi:hypothetical protein